MRKMAHCILSLHGCTVGRLDSTAGFGWLRKVRDEKLRAELKWLAERKDASGSQLRIILILILRFRLVLILRCSYLIVKFIHHCFTADIDIHITVLLILTLIYRHKPFFETRVS